MKQGIILLMAISAVCGICAQETQSLQQLNAEKAALEKKLIEKRAEYIKQEPALKSMYEQIVKLNRELTLSLDAKNDIRELNNKLIETNRKIQQQQTKGGK